MAGRKLHSDYKYYDQLTKSFSLTPFQKVFRGSLF